MIFPTISAACNQILKQSNRSDFLYRPTCRHLILQMFNPISRLYESNQSSLENLTESRNFQLAPVTDHIIFTIAWTARFCDRDTFDLLKNMILHEAYLPFGMSMKFFKVSYINYGGLKSKLWMLCAAYLDLSRSIWYTSKRLVMSSFVFCLNPLLIQNKGCCSGKFARALNSPHAQFYSTQPETRSIINSNFTWKRIIYRKRDKMV